MKSFVKRPSFLHCRRHHRRSCCAPIGGVYHQPLSAGTQGRRPPRPPRCLVAQRLSPHVIQTRRIAESDVALWEWFSGPLEARRSAFGRSRVPVPSSRSTSPRARW